MSAQGSHPPKAPTDSLKLESFKTLSRLQLISQFQPWLQYSIEYTRRRVNSPYFQLWDCLCFGAPLCTLLELVGSPTPRRLAVTADDFDFGLTLEERERFFTSFIQRVHTLEVQGRLPFGEVLKLNDFMDGQNAGFSRILRTVNRILTTLDACYPGLFSVAHGSDARRYSLIEQLIESEKVHVGKLAVTADFCSILYDSNASHVSLECFIVSCSRLVPYHDQVLKGLLQAGGQVGFEPWFYIFAYQNEVFFTQMRISYHSICANYLGFQEFLSEAILDADQQKQGREILRNISSILCRFHEYQNVLSLVLNATVPVDQESYDELCTIVHEARNIASALDDAGVEVRTMTASTTLAPRLKLRKQPNLILEGGTLLLDDYLVVNRKTGEYHTVLLFETRILCYRDHRRSDNVNLESTRYPIRPWEMGPALAAKYPLQIVQTIPTAELKTLNCIDDDYFSITWGQQEEHETTFYPTIHPQFTQWVATLEPFMSRVTHSSSPKRSAARKSAPASIYSRGGASSFLSIQGDKFSSLRQSSIARPWSLIGRKGHTSEASSLLNVETSDRNSIISGSVLPSLFVTTSNLQKSPLRQLFPMNENAETSPEPNRFTDAPTWTVSPLEESQSSILGSFIDGVTDLSGQVVKEGHFPSAHGGYSDVWKGTLRLEDGSEMGVAVKVLRTTTDDKGLLKKIAKLEHEIKVWKRLSHPNVLQLLGVVSDFGPYISMVCPWYENGCISAYMERCGDIIGVDDRLRMVCEIADGLAHLHDKSVVHGDLSGSNILVDKDGHAKICDFGMSVLLNETDSSPATEDTDSVPGGSIRWADTALFLDLDDDKQLPVVPANDVSSLGSVMFEVLSGRIPYHYLRTDHQVVVQLHQGVRPRRPAISFINDAQWELIQLCWDSNLQNRPSSPEVSILARNLLDICLQLCTTQPLSGVSVVGPSRKSA